MKSKTRTSICIAGECLINSRLSSVEMFKPSLVDLINTPSRPEFKPGHVYRLSLTLTEIEMRDNGEDVS